MKLRSKKLDPVLRKVIPSTVPLTKTLPFKVAGYVNDAVIKGLIPEFRQLPPNHLRARVGVGNKIFNNHAYCLVSGVDFWLDAFVCRRVDLNSNVTELGCGYGRKASVLRSFKMQGRRFVGSYLGVDIDDELLSFARDAFGSESEPEFVFQRSNHFSKTYEANVEDESERPRCTIGREDGSQDFVFSTSLFTHLLEPELRNYVEESFRILRPGGCMQMNVFALDFLREAGLLGSRFTFKHRLGEAYVESPASPEAAVAYDRDYLRELCSDVGFPRVEVDADDRDRVMYQSHLRAFK